MKRTLSRLVGWLADRRIPRPLRRAVIGAYCRFSGADPDEAERPVRDYPSLGAFFVRHLRAGARPVDDDPAVLPSPCDGTLQAVDEVREGRLIQAKGRAYELGELLAGAADARALEGATAWTIYLSPRDYHRVHAPLDGELVEVRRVPGTRHSVAPAVLARRPKVLSINERAVLRLATAFGDAFCVMVGALNVGRIRVEGEGDSPPRTFTRGEELARFEMGSTVVLVLPPGAATPREDVGVGASVRLGQPLGRLASPREAPRSRSERDVVQA